MDLPVLVPHRELALPLCVRSRLLDSLSCESGGISDPTLNSFCRHAEHFLVVVARRIRAFASGSLQIYVWGPRRKSTRLVLGQNVRRSEDRIGCESAESETEPSDRLRILLVILFAYQIQYVEKKTTSTGKENQKKCSSTSPPGANETLERKRVESFPKRRMCALARKRAESRFAISFLFA